MKNRYMISCAAAAVLSGWSVAAAAADPAVLPISAAAPAAVATDSATVPPSSVEEVVVTAQRRSQNIENVPATIQAFTGQTLDNLHVNTTTDILKYVPNVTYGNNGPGQGNIFMRGLSAGFAGNQSSATIGNYPNVATYLDDQSFTFPSRNVDVYVVDMDRVEVLEGPQGTLFGGGAEAGAVRYITNKPKMDKYEANIEAQYGFTSGGGDNSSVNATFNIPLVEDKLAVRAVIYDDQRGGYIDNVPSNFTRSNNDVGNYYFGIKPNAAGICPNNLPAGANGCTLPNAPSINNASTAGKNSNPLTYTGARFSALYDINNDWNVLITESVQNMDAEGMFAEYPTGSNFQPLQPLQVTAFAPSYDKDKYENTAWTVNGKLGDLKLVYTGGYMNRHINQQMDYTNYSRTGGGMYYQCTGGSTGFGSGAPTCYSPLGYWDDTVKNTHLSNEVRISTPDTWRLRAIGGVYQENFRIYDVMNFNYKTDPACNATNLALAQAGGGPCVADVTTAPYSTANDPGVRGDSTAFGEDTQRGYDQYAVFGSVDFDIIPRVLTVTAGTRYYQYNEFEVGSVYETGTYCVDVPNGQCGGGEINLNAHNDHVTYQGFKSNANVTWHFAPNSLVYYTFSQGFRPGGFNRTTKSVIPYATSATSAVDQFKEPNGYAPDSLTNNEIGLKTELFEHRLQLNFSAYYMQWDNVQFGIFNPTEQINTTFGTNGANYNVKGVEAQFIGKVIDGLTVQGSGSYNDDTQANSPCLTDNISGTPSFGKCITQVAVKTGTGYVNQSFTNPFGTIGSTPAFSPNFQGNIRARYDWLMGDYKPYVTAGASYTGSMFNQPATYPSGAGVLIPATTQLRYEQPAYATFDASLGIKKDKWTAEIYGTNLFDNHASTFTSSAQFIKSEVPLRPRVIMLKLSSSF
jgi:outer membrane receptor protein involved in Fe transport